MRVTSVEKLLPALTREAMELEEPEVSAVLAEIAGVAEVRLVAGEGSACLKRTGDTFAIEFAEPFLEEHVEDTSEALFVLLHELSHKLRGDLLTAPGAGPAVRLAKNVVADLRLNRHLLDNLGSGKTPGFLGRFYRNAEFPAVLLLPPDAFFERFRGVGCPLVLEGTGVMDLWSAHGSMGFAKLAQAAFASMGLSPETSRSMGGWYAAAWLERRMEADLEEELGNLLGSGSCRNSRTVFLGDHEGTVDLPESLRKKLEGLFGAGDGGGEHERRIDVHSCSVSPALLAAVRAVLEPDARNPAEVEGMRPDSSVVFRPGRREVFLLAGGYMPALCKAPVPVPRGEEQRVHLYLDVSGSMDSDLPLFYGLALHLNGLAGEPYYLFSTRVRAVSRRELQEGMVATDYGTDFSKVAYHAIEQRFTKALLVTDGMGDFPRSTEERMRLAGLRLYGVITGNYFRREWHQRVFTRCWYAADFQLRDAG